jgi:carbonic anhydrase
MKPTLKKIDRSVRLGLLSPLLALALWAAPARATPPHPVHPAEPERAAAAVLAQMLHDNDAFVRSHNRSYFQPFEHEQHPRATVVACADSRFHIQDIDSVPDGDVFEVRNIGNQIDSSEGSVQYALRHLRTPLLLIVGHVGCGAVRAAMEDYGDEPPALRRELDGLHLSIRRGSGKGTLEQRWLENVRNNVHQQVSDALHEYQDEVRSGRLFVVGAIYDFRDDLRGGRGRLHIINVNGDARRAMESPLLREVRRLGALSGARPADDGASAGH